MKGGRRAQSSEGQATRQQLKLLRARLRASQARGREAMETLRAIRAGEVDALVVNTALGEQVFTLQGADQSYRILVERMHEGAATLTAGGEVLYANQRLASLLGLPLERVIGSKAQQWFDGEDRAAVEAMLREARTGEARGEAALATAEGMALPVYVSARGVAVNDTTSLLLVVTDLREQKRSEQMMADERLARAIMESAAEAVVVCDEQGRILRANDAARQMCGANVARVLFTDAVHLELADGGSTTAAAGAAKLHDLLFGAEPVTGLEATLRCAPDGTSRDVLIGAGPLRSDAGRIGGHVITLVDISRRKAAEQTLRRSNARLDLLAQTAGELLRTDAPLAIVGALCRRVMEFLNCQAFRHYLLDQKSGRLHLHACAGLSDAEKKKYEWLDLGQDLCGIAAQEQRRVIAEDVAHSRDAGTAVLKSLGMQAAACHPLLVQGQLLGTLIFGTRTRAHFDADALSLMQAIADQIALAVHRQQGLMALRESEQRLTLALDSGQMGLWERDLRTNQTVCNARLYELLGLTNGSGLETADMFFQRVQPEDRAALQLALSRALQTGADLHTEFRIVRPDGEVRWLAGAGRVLRGSDQRPLRVLGVNYDITERKLAEETLQAARVSAERAKEVAETASHAKDRFLAVLSHELRTPLTPVLTAAQMLESDESLPAEARQSGAMMRRNIELETRLIDDLLDLSRIRSGKLLLRMEPLSVHALLADVLSICSEEAGAQGLHVESALEAQRDVVLADGARLRQVFWNLIKNAIKFTPSGGKIRVQTANAPGGHVRIQVTDTGIGLAPESAARIFHAFEQADSTVTKRYGGLGLGLAISKAVVDAHNGILEAQSPGPGLGATFTVSLLTTTQPLKKRSSRGRNAQPAADLRRVLLVEDHTDTARTMSRLLEHDGFIVHTVPTVKGALELAAREPFDVVISDLGLPDGTGYELMESLRKRHGLRGIALSGYGMDKDVQRSHAAGFSEHLVKPVDVRALRDAIRRLAARDPLQQTPQGGDGADVPVS